MASNTSATPISKVSILLVDDYAPNLLALEVLLENLGQNLVKAQCGEEALEKLLEGEFAVILLDVQMHGMDGYETAKRIREREETRTMPIIFLTAYDSNRLTIEDAYRLGAVDYLVKPLVPYILQAKVAGFVELFQQKQQIKRQAEQLRRQSEELHRRIVDTANEGIWTLDAENRTTYVNQRMAEMLGYRAEEMLGRSILDFLFEADHEAGKQGVERRKQGRREQFDFRFRRQDGRELWVICSATPTQDDEGQYAGYLGMFTDITDRKALEKALAERAGQLTEADRQKDLFLAVLAHELRNHLAPLRNALNIVRQAGMMTGKAEPVRDMMDRQVLQMSRLVDDLMDSSRIGQGKLKLCKERLDLAILFNQVVESSRPLVEARRHHLTVVLPNDPICVEADAARLHQVMLNLVNNAAKYSDEGARIWLSATREGHEVVLRVRDTGIGIRSEVLPHIFEMFVQSDRAIDRAQGGLGIGLSLVKKLVELHGGSVTAHSDGPGQGSEFVVRLPP